MFSDDDLHRFWSHVDIRSDIECWLWGIAKFDDGYGAFSIDGQSTRAHRVSWSLVNGGIPHGMHVLHSCDTRACVNPAHLRLGTNNDNVADKVARHRQARHRGADNPTAKITEEDVAMIVSLLRSGQSQRCVGNRFGISQKAVCNIWSGRSWGWLTGLNGSSE